MRTLRAPRAALVPGAVVLLAAAIVGAVSCHVAPGNSIGRPVVAAPEPRTGAEVALREAARHRFHARRAALAEVDVMEEWDPQAAAIDPEAMRLEVLARDKGGHLRQALELAYKAETLAETRNETRLVLVLQVLVEHELGHHEIESQRAAALRDLAPDDHQVRAIYRRVQKCRGRPLPP